MRRRNPVTPRPTAAPARGQADPLDAVLASAIARTGDPVVRRWLLSIRAGERATGLITPQPPRPAETKP